MTRVYPLPGSRGPFLGPDGKHLAQYQDAERLARDSTWGGLVFDVAKHCAYAVGPVPVATGINDTKFVPLDNVRERWVLTAARMSLQTGTSPTAECALYSYTAGGGLTMVPNSRAFFSFPAVGVQKVQLQNTCYIEPEKQYFFASRYNAALGCTFATAQVTTNTGSPAVLYKATMGSLPGATTIKGLTKVEAPFSTTADRRFIMACYLTSEGERVF